MGWYNWISERSLAPADDREQTSDLISYYTPSIRLSVCLSVSHNEFSPSSLIDCTYIKIRATNVQKPTTV